MSADQIVRLAKQRIVKLSIDLEIDLRTKQRGNVAIEILHRLQDRAAESLAAMAICDVTELRQLVALQNEVKRYDEWVVWLREIIAEGKAYDREMNEQDREEMLDFLSGTPEGQEQAVALGLVDPDQRE
jgi:hypothetical protein